MQMLQKLALNQYGRDILVGDIHNQHEKLIMELDALGFDPARGDRLIALGDLVGRNPGGNRAAYFMSQPWFFHVRGNHCQMAIDAFKGVVQFEDGVEVLAAETIALLERSPLAIELETKHGVVGLVHADVPFNSWTALRSTLTGAHPASSGYQEAVQECLWGVSRSKGRRDGQPVTGEGLRAVVVGHTPVELPTWSDNVLMIDTATKRGGQFTLIDAHTLKPLMRERKIHLQIA